MLIDGVRLLGSQFGKGMPEVRSLSPCVGQAIPKALITFMNSVSALILKTSELILFFIN